MDKVPSDTQAYMWLIQENEWGVDPSRSLNGVWWENMCSALPIENPSAAVANMQVCATSRQLNMCTFLVVGTYNTLTCQQAKHMMRGAMDLMGKCTGCQHIQILDRLANVLSHCDTPVLTITVACFHLHAGCHAGWHAGCHAGCHAG